MAEQSFMQRALALAAEGRGRVEPNPMVGAVIERGGEVLGEGWHAAFGHSHAEVAAVADCRSRGHDPAGACMYVTLEPCAHAGKTPPCTEALIQAGIARVVVAMQDPDARVSGRGLARLREAGIDVEVDVGGAEAAELNAPFIKRVTRGRPWVMLKWAQTLDGKIAARSGDSRWISGAEARKLVHAWRGRVDAVMVGIGTALADDPQLTARDAPALRQARAVVVDPDTRLPESSRLVWERAASLTLAVREGAAGSAAGKRLRGHGAELIELPAREDGALDLDMLLAELVERYTMSNVLVEGGAGLAGRLLEQGLADQVLAFVSPKVLGDAQAVAAVTGRCCDRIDQAIGLSLRAVERVGEDVLLDYRSGG